MAKTKTLYLHILCFFICCSVAGQDSVGSFDQSLSATEQKREQLQTIYQSQVGVREQGGANRGAQVEQYLAAVNFGPGYAWCAAFVSWCYQQVDIDHPRSAWVPSYALAENLIYKRGEFIRQLPQSGDAFLIWFDRLKRPAHIGFVEKWQAKWVITVEGNTNDDGSREGDGVYRKRRLQRQVWAVADFID